MRSKLLLILGLGVLGACLVAGSAVGQGGSVVGVGEGGVQINIPDGGDLDEVQVLPQCSNTADDDGDGITDMADPDCTGPLDASESGSSGVPEPPTTTPEPPTDDGGSADGGGGGSDGTETTTPEPDGTVGPTGTDGRGTGELEESDVSKPDRNPNNEDDAKTAAPAPRSTPRPTATPTAAPPTPTRRVTIADFGPAPIGVPNFVIDQFTIPPFLLPIYQACGTQYGIPWQVLASINRIETAFGTNLNVSTAGALGWMQFMPATWEMYGVDANDDGRKDPYNPVDAICAAARYLNAAGGADDLRTAIFAYNHADWYVDEVLLYANQYGKLPETLVSSLTGLTEGAHFPVAANARYADDISERRALERSKPARRQAGNVAEVISLADHPPRDQHLRPRGRPGGRRQRRRRHRARQVEAPRPLHRLARHLRQPLHLRRARRGRRRLPGAQAAQADRRRLRARHPRRQGADRARDRRRPARRRRPRRPGPQPRRAPRQGPRTKADARARRRPSPPTPPRRPTAPPTPPPTPPSRPTPRTRASASMPTPSAPTTPGAPGSPASSTSCWPSGCPAMSRLRAISPT